MKKLFAALALATVAFPLWAATQTVTLSVPGMTCPTCPITVKMAISIATVLRPQRATAPHAFLLPPHTPRGDTARPTSPHASWGPRSESEPRNLEVLQQKSAVLKPGQRLPSTSQT